MKRLKLDHEYHDAVLRSVEIRGPRMTFVVDLCPSWNNKVQETRHLFFDGVRNVDELREQLGLAPNEVSAEIGAEIVGIVRDDDGRILVDMMSVGAVRIACKSLSET